MSEPERERVNRSTNIFIGSMFGLFSKQGSVKLELVGVVDGGITRQHVLLEPTEARRQAMYLLEAAGAAERDAAFYRVASAMGMSDDDAGRFLQACRAAHDRGDPTT